MISSPRMEVRLDRSIIEMPSLRSIDLRYWGKGVVGYCRRRRRGLGQQIEGDTITIITATNIANALLLPPPPPPTTLP